MEIIFIKEAQSSQDIVSQVKNSIISRIEQAVNAINSGYQNNSTQSLILPIVPKENPFKKDSEINNYKGLKYEYNLPSYQSLRSFSWSSFFPVNKGYSFQHIGSNLNGYDYVDFIEERQTNILPFRLIAFDTNTITRMITGAISNVFVSGSTVQDYLSSPIKIFYDGFVVVKAFQYVVDNAKDLTYSITLEEFNTDILASEKINWTEIGVNVVRNSITKYALQSAGLI